MSNASEAEVCVVGAGVIGLYVGAVLAEQHEESVESRRYLGLGVRVPTTSWGNMLQEAQQFYQLNWTNVFFPGFMVFLTVLCINMIGNGLRDALDPRLSD